VSTLGVQQPNWLHEHGSATECAACLDALVAKHACTSERVQPGNAMLERVVSMLTKLVARFESDDSDKTQE
jgi:hypothetical protein